jgi:hypothetical protein
MYENLCSEMLEEIAHVLAERQALVAGRLRLSWSSNPRTVKNSMTAFAAEIELDTGSEEVYLDMIVVCTYLKSNLLYDQV